MKLCTRVQLLPDTPATLIAFHRWKQLLLSIHSTESKRLMASTMFLYSDFFKFEGAVKLFLCLLANWDVWGDGKLVDQSSKKSHWEEKNKERREKVTNRAAVETVRSCQAGSCPHNVTHLPPQTGCTQELRAANYHSCFFFSLTYSYKDRWAFLTCHCCLK